MAVSVLDTIDFTPTQILLGGLLLVGIAYRLYRSMLPQPFDGIPYNVAATNHIFGDLPEVKAYGSLTDWLATQAVKHQSPIFQAFIRPLAKPWVIIADHYEAAEICTQRLEEFDRGTASTSLFHCVVPSAHITLKSSNPQFKKNKDLVRNLMTPTFLSEVSAPEIYDKFSKLLELWNMKTEHTNDKFFSASNDVHNAALDIIVCAAFGLDTANTQLVKEIEQLNTENSSSGEDGEIVFEEVSLNEELHGLKVLAESVAKIIKTPLPPLFHFLHRNLSGSLRKAITLSKQLQRREIANGIKRRERGEAIKCALDEISLREEAMAKKEGREPDYYSEVITSELMTYLIGGHETTSSALRWGLSYLSSDQRAQSELRNALQQAYHQAKSERRAPTLAEILQIRVPYLDAVVEEVLRVSYPFGMCLREVQVDTQILGARVPKGTTVAFLSNGPSILSPPISYDQTRSSEWVNSRKTKQPLEKDYDYAGFVPERWLRRTTDPGGKEEITFDSQAFPIQAFGSGPRGCFGRRMSYLEMKIFFTLVVWTFELLPLPSSVATPKAISSLTRNPDRVFVKLGRVVL
ncbi:cytochrome P450 monooxygenase [Fusarium heterosporum]|uniref:Cytochrome P450 monooxygenase n=1 Tax=Fusarium heterosporum TaxID=42747 RepID=A0A8H5U4F6_FUSHE|nr:cytochrome P450 monooxygenase [Fusarium heterosporum]